MQRAWSEEAKAWTEAMRLPWRLLVVVAAALFGLGGCGGSEKDSTGKSTDTSGDLGSETDASADSGAAPDSAAASCPPAPVAAGSARARALACAADLPKGPLVVARVDDVVLENSLARFVVRAGAEGEAIIGLPGGNVVDAVRVAPDGSQLGHDSLREWVPIVGMHVLVPEAIEVVPDPKDAVVRVRGKLEPFAIVHAYLPLDLPPVDVVHEYRLAPDVAVLEIRTRVTPHPGKTDASIVGDASFWGGRVGLFRPRGGDTETGITPKGNAAVLGLTPLRADPNLIPAAIGFEKGLSTVDAGGILAFIQPPGAIPAEGKTFVRRLALAADAPASLADAMAAAGVLSGETTAKVEGTVQGYAPGVEVELVDAEDLPLTRCTPDSSGAFSCPAPTSTRGARARWVGNGEGQGGGRGQDGAVVAIAWPPSAPVAVVAPIPGRITVAVRDPSGAGIPFQAVLLPGKDVAGAGDRVFVDGDGDATFLVPPGTWTVWLNHGPEWSAHSEQVEAKAGATASVKATLSHVVDSTGWVAADTHIHAEHSSDSDVPNRERILDAVAAGLDYAVATDHDYVTDYTPFVEAAGLTGKITVASGVEVSTAKYGHHGVWPMSHDPSKAGGGPPTWYGKDAEQLCATIRGGVATRIHQLNHPRGSQSYFQGIALQPGKTDAKLLTFDALELLNGKRIDDTEEVLLDWFGLLGTGHRSAATGASDAHGLSSGAGNARSYIFLGSKDGKPRDVQGVFTGPEADAAIRAGATVASTGPLVAMSLAGEVTVTAGQTLQGAKGSVRLRVVVQAPEWMPLGPLAIFRNGEELHVADLAGVTAVDGLRRAEVEFTAPAATKAGWWTAVLRPDPSAKRPPIQARPVWAVCSPVYESP
ncbi:MAG: PHP domain-containing protein [Deltaproteobacteria bacterium]|nr:PHP domain-containing protein [Deltaproteobacteria bacterium]